MEMRVLLFLLFLALKALSQDTTDWVRIDCGSYSSYPVIGDNTQWLPDDEFIKTGTNEAVSWSRFTALDQLNTLRVFTQQNKNCYTLPTLTAARYFIRAAFYYGNYDGHSKPPTFDLEFDGNKWATVETYVKYFSFYELVYANRGDNISICLARTFHDQFPFISSLELWPLPDDMYAGMTSDKAWFQSYRFNYGAADDEWIFGYPTDQYNRIWAPMTPEGLNRTQADFSSLDNAIAEHPPESAILDAVTALSPTDTISLDFKFNKRNTLNHVVAYFTEVAPEINITRSFDFYVNDKFIKTITAEYETCTVAWTNASTLGAMTVELRPPSDSLLSPIISAIEVYTASDPVTTATSNEDLAGLGVLISTFEQLEGWSGEPCLPSDTIWQWLNCTGNNPPRVTSINLSTYDLYGYLPDFSQMQALETIDLANNSLEGPIPDFLGHLPDLRLLNLSYNNFSGSVPRSITKSKTIKLQIEGNPNLHHHKKKNLALIIGLAVGIPVGVALVLALLFFLIRRQARPSQGQPQGKPQPENAPVSVSTDGGNFMAMPTRDNRNAGSGHILESTGAGSVGQSSGVPAGLDRAELDELIGLRYGNTRTDGRS